MHALMDTPQKALAALGQLKTLNTDKARAKLKKAPKDSDFASMLKHPGFVKLTAP